MTREEAITVLKAFMKNPLFSEVHKAAFNIAIHDIKAYQDWNINNLILVNKDNYEPTTKNNLGVDCISRADAIRVASGYCHPSNIAKELANLPSVTPQEPFKPMVEIGLYSVIKQKYIEREVLNKIREQIKSNLRGVEITLEVLVENDPLRPQMEGAKTTLEECLELIDKAEKEQK